MSFQNYLCQVSGCTVDLRKEGQPGLKLRTCEAHRKSGSVVVDGVPSRYCQQCVKLHPLDEFDGEKRGCRRRLESHNRRRKQKSTLRRQESEVKQNHEQATLRMSSDASQDERRPKNRRRPSVASDDSSHATEPPMMRSSSGQSDNFSRAKTGQGTNRKCPRHDQTDIMNSEAHVARCDAYLLGQRPQLLTTAVGFQYEGSESIPSHAGVQLPLHDLQLLDALDRACGLKPGSSAPVFPGLLTQQMDMDMLLGSGCLSDEPLAPGPSPPVMGNMEAASNTTSLPPDASLSQQSFHTTMKIANATPLDLPPDLHQALIGMHEAVPLDVTGTIRPGCVHLSLQFTMRNAEDHDVACETFGRNLVAGITRGGSMPWCRFDTDIFLPDAVVRVRGGGASVSIQPRPRGPVIQEVRPLASTGGEVTILVSDLQPQPVTVLCRSGGRQHELDITSRRRGVSGSLSLVSVLLPQEYGTMWLEVVQEGEDIMRLSSPAPVILVDSQEVADEISCVLPKSENSKSTEIESLLKQIGYLLYSDDDFSLLSCASCAFHLARLGLPETFREVVGMGQMKGLAMQDVVGAINTKPAGALLAQAVLSGSAATVKVVLAMLEEAGLPSNVCEPDPSNGMTVLHWAALRSTKDVIEILLAVCPECTAAFAALAAGPGSLTPMMILQHRQRLNQTMETNEAEDGATPDAGDSGAESACRHTTLPPSKPQWPGTRPMHHGLLFLLLTGAGSLAGSLAYSRLSILQLSWAAFLMLVACGSSWVCWKQCQEAIEHARSLAEPMGVVLSWDSEPEDPSLAAAFEAFGVSKMRNLINFSWMAFTALASSLSPAAVYANVKAVRCVAAAVTLGVTSNLLILRKRAIPRHSLTAFQRVNWFPAIVVALSYLLPSLWAWLHAYPDITMPLRINAVKTLCSLILPYLVYGITVGCSQALLFNTPLKTCFPLRMIIGTFFLITGSLRAANTERTVGYLVPDGLLGCQVLSVFAAASSCVRLSIQLEQHCMELFLRQLKAGPMESQSSRIWTSRQQSGCPYLTSMRHDQANISNCNVGKICPLRGCN